MALNTVFIIKQHDLLPRYEFTLLDERETGLVAVDLSYALRARMLMRNIFVGLKIDQPVVILDQSIPENLGKGYYEWQLGDTDTPGAFRVEIEVLWADGRPQTFPANRYATVKILRDLDNPAPITHSGTGQITANVTAS